MQIHRTIFALSSFACAVIGTLDCGAATTSDGYDRLANRFSLEWFRENIIPRGEFKPYPTADDRPAWLAVDKRVKDSVLSEAVAALSEPWQAFPATRYLDFSRNGDRSRFQGLYFGRRQRGRVFTLAECIEGQGRYMDEVVNGIWLVAEESSWVLPAHMRTQRAGRGLPDVTDPTIDLFAAETGAQLAWIDYLLGPKLDEISPLIRSRITEEINRRLLTPFLANDGYSWMGFRSKGKLHNWSPWIVSNILACALLNERDEARRTLIVHRCLQILDNYLSTQTADGGCEEGPAYWGRSAGSAFDTLDLFLLATAGKLNGFSSPKFRAMGQYIYRVNIAEQWFVNFADASPKPAIEGTLCYRFGERLGDRSFMSFGAWFAQRERKLGIDRMESLSRSIPGILRYAEVTAALAELPLPRQSWFADLQVLAVRGQQGSDKGLFLAAKGGNNGESHNHNDVGSCVVFADGRPVFVDPGVGSYTGKTFSADRYSIWTMQSAYHNLPTINGVMQSAGAEFAATDVEFRSKEDDVSFRLNIAQAYPAEARVSSWHREYTLRGATRITVSDEYSLSSVIAPLEWHFLMPEAPRLVGPGTLTLYTDSDRPVTIRFDSECTTRIDEVDTNQPGLRNPWGERLYRLTFIRSGSATGVFTLEVEMAE